jgi:hypothetical protein
MRHEVAGCPHVKHSRVTVDLGFQVARVKPRLNVEISWKAEAFLGACSITKRTAQAQTNIPVPS